MRVLHICSYYIGNKLYNNLVKSLSFKNINQIIYIPIREKVQFGKNQLPSTFETVKYEYSNILKKSDRYFFIRKISKQKKDIECNILSEVLPDVIHAHTVFSDGGTAYLLYKKYKVKYTVNIRNTDINYFYKYAIHLRPLMYKILLNAESIVFISYAYQRKMFSLLPSQVVSKIKNKCLVIPNGISDYWHNNLAKRKSIKESTDLTLLFIGTLNKNKNIKTVVYSCHELIKRGYNIKLNIIGNGPMEQEVKNLCEKLNIYRDTVFHGYINDKSYISSIMDKSDIFIMPSIKETFGLTYIEAMSRGLPVLYSSGQGIDGFFEEGKIGYSVDPYNINSIVDSIHKIVNEYDTMSVNCIELSKQFNWKSISEDYIKLYQR
ncbi:hypothetical protein J14TS2_00960 [Bacillus sp. J14TS2]|uniref:glycosyltransferase family 4 protein n=1 Tax=Bacillus sp. J14TS2 TaxID=2807188 RepID=UPI001B1DC828|nr:glycosyltransferase family 4 protein [Bacillus sp. J14TS2]GIN69621.1 hypothetical protein J14TS2_00960 [Bacillus sp. J14TS2]